MVSCRFHFLRFASAAIALGGLGCLHASSAAAQGAGSIKGVVFFDKNGDGVRQNDEPGFSGVVVAIFGKRVDQRPFYMTTVTDSEGRFAFNGALIGDGSSFTVSTGGTPMAAAMPTHYRPRRTFYTAAKGGDDQGPGTLQRPFRTIGRAVPALALATCFTSARASTGNLSPPWKVRSGAARAGTCRSSWPVCQAKRS